MSGFGLRRFGTAAAAVGLGAAVLAVPSGAHAAYSTPSLRLLSAVSHLELDRFGTDPHLYVSDPAYVASVNGAFEIDAMRTNHEIVLHQVIRSGSHTALVRTIRPAGRVRMPIGLPDFFTTKLTNSTGQVVANSQTPFCPAGGYDTERIDPSNSPLNPTYPQQCGDKLTRAMVWGIDAGWATGLSSQLVVGPKAAPDGKYTLTISITPSYARQLKVPARDASVTESVHLVTESGGGCTDICPPIVESNPPSASAVAYPQPSPSGDSGIGSPGLPDLVALPAHDLSIEHRHHSGRDYLDFGATIWNAGPGTFDIEGFRHSGRHTMQARQYIGRPNGSTKQLKIGTFEFDTRVGQNHWNLEDVARYSLLNADGSRVVLSHKQSFCLAPTDPINLLRKGADLNQNGTQLYSACPSEQSLWLRETLPVGWGDTYFQSAGCSAFNITSVPNGTYLIRIRTNPHGNIHEVTRSNNSSYLKIKLGGTPGARTITTVGSVAAPH